MLLRLSLLLLVAACASSGAATPPVPREAEAVPVKVAAVTREKRTPAIHAVGVLASKAEVRLSFKVGGIVEKLAAEEGKVVRKGDVLARLSTPEVDSAVAQARQGAEKADRDLARVKELHAERVATLEQLQNATTQVDVARAQLVSAEFNRRHAVIRAPADGRILKRLVEEHELVAPGTPIVVLGSDDAGWVVRVGLVDKDVVRLRLGDRAALALDAWPGESFPATVSEIASSASPPIGTFEVEVHVAAPARPLLSGMIAHVTLSPQAVDEVALVPLGALVDGEGMRAAVWSPQPGGTVRRHPIDVAWIDGDSAAVRRGLDGVGFVVVDGAPYLDATSRIAP
jgi:membrane fusion protein, multidrug efflux system